MRKNNSFLLRKVAILRVLMLVIFTVSLVFLTSCFNLIPTKAPEQSPDELYFEDLLNVISDRFIGTYDRQELIDAAMRGIVDALDDPWSYYMTPAEFTIFLENTDNRYIGIGVEVVVDDFRGGIEVRGVYRESGADLAGIVIGDVITAVDGESLRGLSLVDVRSLLRREVGSTVILTVLRADGEYHDLTVLYDVVVIDPISFDMIDGNIGYVAIKNFEAGAANGFISAVEALINQGATSFIYDVRSNNGGRLDELVRILDFLLPEGEIFIHVDRAGDENITYSDASFIDLPAAVLVNSYSFSAAEYFAAILGENKYAYTIGDQTTGKNRTQVTLRLSNGGAVHLSTGMYLTPNRVSLFDEGGFTPEFLLPLTDEEFALFRRGDLNFSDDPQVQKAIELLK
ncbi:MAG: PDZ domain-containing protein [Oscillospiraceae bacterium]|jgi:carboxyl-terminal processing protease|nr:PDZ domain-containing protein [Oscillospiraceae bacterium]